MVRIVFEFTVISSRSCPSLPSLTLKAVSLGSDSTSLRRRPKALYPLQLTYREKSTKM